MNKKILLVAASLLSFLCSSRQGFAQQDANLFKLPDTVCNGHEIVPFNIVQTASNYFWTFCPPNLNSQPEGTNSGVAQQGLGSTKGFLLAESDSIYYSFVLNADGSLGRMRYADGLEGSASMITSLATNLTNPGAIYLANDSLWHLFAVYGSDSSSSRLVRFDFNENGLKSSPTRVDLGNLGGGLYGPKVLYIAKQGDNWYGFSFNKNDELLRLSFGTDLSGTPTLENLGNIDDHFDGVSAITGIVELDNWHIFVTNRSGSTVERVSFGNSLANTPYVISLGNFNSRINQPVGIAVTKDCDSYYGFVLNYGTGSFVTLRWPDQSIANTPEATNHGDVAGFIQLRNLSGIARENGALYLFATNGDNTISKIKFPSCTSATPAYSDLRLPPSFVIDEPGTYTVFLTIDEGLPTVSTDCEQVYVYAHPPLTISNDTLLCQGDSIRLTALGYDVDSFKWTPDYNIDTLYGQFVNVTPRISTTYEVTAYYSYNCIIKTPIDVTVSKIVADAGVDQIVLDGATSIVGGPGTTIGSQYTYDWTPDIGFESARNVPFATVRPPYNVTYYLNVTNTDGCRTIDSVYIKVPCNDINLPNAFKPNSGDAVTSKFGPLNQQLIKINYFKIFDRWGKEVFGTYNVGEKWDGTIDGKEAPVGVYVWEIDANCANTQERFKRSGSVTLIR
ncbi:MAG: gliding motility-associated C-terminal domain-containing protein [Edaphocola sp.]